MYAVLAAACGDTVVELAYERPRLRLLVPPDVERVSLVMLTEVGGELRPVPGMDVLRKDCPCNGRTVEVLVPPGTPDPWVVAVGFRDDLAVARGRLLLSTAPGEQELELSPIECTDADTDGACGDEPAPWTDCDDADPARRLPGDCAGTPPEDVEEPDAAPLEDSETAEDAPEPRDNTPDDAPDPSRYDDGTEPDAAGDGAAADPGPETDVPELGSFGEPCVTDADCESGSCILTAAGYACSQLCGECPAGFVCKPVPAGGSKKKDICLPVFLELCAPCSSDADCLGFAGISSCVEFPEGAGSFCGGDCSEMACPDGYLCSGGDQCVPEGWECTCPFQAVDEGLSTECWFENEHGKCLGKRVCEPPGLTPCSAAKPSAEVCDDLDNDCDGKTDEDLPCGQEPCGADPHACTGADPCMEVACKEGGCALSPSSLCFPKLDFLGTAGGCRRYRLAGSAGPDLCRVPAGAGLRGSSGDAPENGPEHLVMEPTFFVMRNEVSEDQLLELAAAYDEAFPGGAFNCGTGPPAHWIDGAYPEGTGAHPARGICWETAKKHCEWLGLQLPSESQWERAARGTDGRRYPWGDSAPDGEKAVFESGSAEPAGDHPAGASPSGVLDLAGNVAEWVYDGFDPGAYCAATGAEAPCSEPGAIVPVKPKQDESAGCPTAGECRLVRGGGWSHEGAQLSSWRREAWPPGNTPESVGYRCGLAPAAGPLPAPAGCCSTAPTLVAGGEPYQASAPSAAAGPEGGIAALWVEVLVPGKQFDLRLRRFDDEGSPLGASASLQVLGPSLGGAHPRTVVWTGAKTLLVVFEHEGEVLQRRYDAGGNAIGDLVKVSSGTAQSDFVQDAGVAVWPDGSTVVCSSPGARFATFLPDGTPQSGLVTAPAAGEAGTAGSCAVAVLDGGSFAAVWRSTVKQTGHGALFGIDGSPVGAAFQVGKASGGQAKDSQFGPPAVAAVAGGRFVVAWPFGGGDAYLEVRSPEAVLFGAFAATSGVEGPAPLRLVRGPGPWLELFYVAAGLHRRAFRLLPAGKPQVLTAPRLVAGDAAEKSLRSVSADRHGRTLVTWTNGDEKGVFRLLAD